MGETAPRPHVIAERYLTSPAALAARPFGPVDALDTHSGRGRQVRIVFVDGGWGDAALADAVTRWCAIGCSEVCGVLDFGRHDDRWYLVLPSSLGLPVERWRSLRRPAAGDAVRLLLAFGRVAERVAAAGFSPDAAVLADIAVGPGPTPFLERPLLAEPGHPAPTGDGQRLLAAVCDAALGPAEPPAALSAWRERARAAEFTGLGECLDELERCGSAAVTGGETADPPGLDHLFDPGFDLDGPGVAGPPPRDRRLAVWAPAILIGLVAAMLLLGHLRPTAHAPVPTGAATGPLPVAPAATSTVRRQVHPPRRAARTQHQARRPGRRHARRAAHPKTAVRATTTQGAGTTAGAPTVTTPQPPAATGTPAPTPSGGSSTTLPAPGGTTLPGP